MGFLFSHIILWVVLQTGGCDAFLGRPFAKSMNRRALNYKKYYPYSSHYFEQYIKRLNSQNISIQHRSILNDDFCWLPVQDKDTNHTANSYTNDSSNMDNKNKSFYKYNVIMTDDFAEIFNLTLDDDGDEETDEGLSRFLIQLEGDDDGYDEEEDDDVSIPEVFYKQFQKRGQKRSKNQVLNADEDGNDNDSWENYKKQNRKKSGGINIFGIGSEKRSGGSRSKAKSENFEVISTTTHTFEDIGGYDLVKQELLQCVDILANYTKYQKYNIRIPKGIILEGPPGNGKTMLAKGFAGEANASFIAVSGSEFQEKYVGVGSTRVKELFQLAKENIPCIIFIDEIDAIGRARSGDSESSSSERDNTLNQLLVNMDGFSTVPGIFVIGATNRADLLDPALLRPGRIDKRVFIGMPDAKTREAILRIHIQGKPHTSSVNITDLVDLTIGLSGAQIENVLNEAMLFAIRNDMCEFTINDIDEVMNRIMVGWQPSDHKFTNNMLEQIAIHEMGHAIVGLLAKHHSKMTKIVINLSSPQSPGYTVFEGTESALYTRDSLFEHLMILLAGRIAEEVFYNVSVTTGAINDFEEALKLSEKMILYYGMGENLIYPSSSEKYKEMIDNEVIHLIQDAYRISHFIVRNCKSVIQECAERLQKDKILRAEDMMDIITTKYPEVFGLYTG